MDQSAVQTIEVLLTACFSAMFLCISYFTVGIQAEHAMIKRQVGLIAEAVRDDAVFLNTFGSAGILTVLKERLQSYQSELGKRSGRFNQGIERTNKQIRSRSALFFVTTCLTLAVTAVGFGVFEQIHSNTWLEVLVKCVIVAMVMTSTETAFLWLIVKNTTVVNPNIVKRRMLNQVLEIRRQL